MIKNNNPFQESNAKDFLNSDIIQGQKEILAELKDPPNPQNLQFPEQELDELFKKSLMVSIQDYFNQKDEENDSQENANVDLQQNRRNSLTVPPEQPNHNNHVQNRHSMPQRQIEKKAIQHNSKEPNILLFNKKPKLFVDEQLQIGKSPNNIANFIFGTKGLSKQAIGLYLGLKIEPNETILWEFTSIFQFKDKEVDKALREYLSKFRLPGEYQQIEKILSSFSNVYYLQNQEAQVFESQEIASNIVFIILGLHTTNHNKNIKQKIDEKTFVNICSKLVGSNSKVDFKQIYFRVVNSEFKCEENKEEILYNILNETHNNLDQDNYSKQEFFKYDQKQKEKQERTIFANQETLFWKLSKQHDDNARRIQIRDICDIEMVNKNEIILHLYSKTRKNLHLIADENKRNSLFAFLYEKVKKCILENQKNEVVLNITQDEHNKIMKECFCNIECYFDFKLKIPYFLKEYFNLKPPSQDKKYSLIKAWKQGLPCQSRKRIYELLVGNSLGINQILFQELEKFSNNQSNQASNNNEDLLNMEQSYAFQIKNSFFVSNLRTQFQSQVQIMKEEMNEFVLRREYFQKYAEKVEKMMLCFLWYKQDVNYLKGSVSIAFVLCEIFEDKFEYFRFFTNIMHKWHFEKFLFKNQSFLLQKEAFFKKILAEKFQFLQEKLVMQDIHISYLNSQFVSVFSSIFSDVKVMLRLLDNFFLEGESYLFKVALGIIQMNRFSLKYNTYQETISLLCQEKFLEKEELIFNYIENLNNIENFNIFDKYEAFLKEQNKKLLEEAFKF